VSVIFSGVVRGEVSDAMRGSSMDMINVGACMSSGEGLRGGTEYVQVSAALVEEGGNVFVTMNRVYRKGPINVRVEM